MSVLSTNQPNNGSLKFEFADKPGRELLRELIVYIAGQCSEDAAFGATKLNKILYFADFLSYARYNAVFISDEGITEEDRALTRELFPQYSDPLNLGGNASLCPLR